MQGLKTESIYCLIDPFNLKTCLELDSKTEYLKNSHFSDKAKYPWFSIHFKLAQSLQQSICCIGYIQMAITL